MAPLKLAIVGGGPSAFYVASRLQSLFDKNNILSSRLKVHVYDKLWAPHGLVRYGVAPDHPEVKNCTHKFDEAAADERFKFFGNVQVGTQTASIVPHALSLPLSSLLPHYTHLLFSTGCTVPILHPALPPSEHVIPALSMVHWYTQHPSRPDPPPLDKTSHVTLIGQGNVSLDVARMLLTSPSVLEKYDVPEPVLNVLRRSAVKHVSIVGRRGPLQAAFTTKELREMMNLSDASMDPLDPDVLVPPADTKLTRQQSRTLQLLQKGSVNKPGTTPKTWSLDFFRSPTGLAPPASGHTSAQLSLAHTALDANARAAPTGATSQLSTDLVVTALGHRADPAQAFYDPQLSHLRTVAGRVINEHGQTLRNVYASGWAAMGARGVLASTLLDAYAVADTILTDYLEKVGDEVVATTSVSRSPTVGHSPEEILATEVEPESIPREIEEGLREGRVAGYEEWKAVDAEEVRRGAAMGKERERMGWEEASRFLGRSLTAKR
ncbi:FAD/NAD-P-binding domain-containing protein [Amylostereum chailletii]|nr:FAD/NAD-P-binding domain-containing protein [Amylostereum chailletii]